QAYPPYQQYRQRNAYDKVRLPEVQHYKVRLPEVQYYKVRLPEVQHYKVKLPEVQYHKVRLPEVQHHKELDYGEYDSHNNGQYCTDCSYG
ncbi:hypothetical protein V2W45_1349685, partial [Cenococcum geophilum]